MKRKFSLLIITLIATFFALSACEDDTKETAPETTGSYTLLASVEGKTIDEVATSISQYFANIDDTENGMVSDWVVAGDVGEGEVMEYVLKLPGGHRIIEVCNHYYAEQALGFGAEKSLGLPCKIGVVQEGETIQVILLDPGAVFALFFSDVPAEMIDQMAGLASQVHTEITDLIDLSLTDTAGYTKENSPVGPSWSNEQIAAFNETGYNIEYSIEIPAEFEGTEEEYRALVIETILTTATHEDMEEVGSKVEGLTVADWRSARIHPITMPGNITVVELCSPTYATAALGTGLWHAPALPCKVSVYAVDGEIKISVLDTNFMFPTLFGDTPDEMAEQLNQMAGAVRADIMAITEASITALQ
jgi:uncharacterized protein (DUF302 family)